MAGDTNAQCACASRHCRAAPPPRLFEDELGVQDAVGFGDPHGFTSDGDLLALKSRREVELQHGRIAMLATMGYITPKLVGNFPGYLSSLQGWKYADVPNVGGQDMI